MESNTSIKQLMVVKNTGKGWVNRGIATALMFRIEHDLVKLNVRGVIKALRVFNSHNDWVYVQGVWSGRDRGAVWELEETNAAILPASLVHCRFYGGPPTCYQHYTGTLLTMLMDRAMSAALSEGMLAVKKLFPNVVLTNL